MPFRNERSARAWIARCLPFVAHTRACHARTCAEVARPFSRLARSRAGVARTRIGAARSPPSPPRSSPREPRPFMDEPRSRVSARRSRACPRRKPRGTATYAPVGAKLVDERATYLREGGSLLGLSRSSVSLSRSSRSAGATLGKCARYFVSLSTTNFSFYANNLRAGRSFVSLSTTNLRCPRTQVEGVHVRLRTATAHVLARSEQSVGRALVPLNHCLDRRAGPSVLASVAAVPAHRKPPISAWVRRS